MNLHGFINRGIREAGIEPAIQAAPLIVTPEGQQIRALLIDALVADETRAWMSIDGVDREVVNGFITTLTLVGLAAVHDKGRGAPVVRIIQEAIARAQQAARGDARITVAWADMFSSAAGAARSFLVRCTDEALIAAAQMVEANQPRQSQQPATEALHA